MTDHLQGIGSPPKLLYVGNFLSHSSLATQGCEEFSNRFELDGWEVLRTSAKSGRTARLLDMVSTVVRRRNDFDLAHIDVFSGKAFIWSEAVASILRALGKPYVLTLHGGRLPEFSSSRPRRTRRLLDGARVVTCPSSHLAERLGAFRSEIRVIPNPLDLRAFAYEERTEVRPRLVWVRAFHRIYEPWVAVEVLGRLADTYEEATLVMHGPDKGDGSLSRTMNTVDRLGLAGRVAVREAVPKSEVPDVLQGGDIFLNTAAVDNMPRSVVEAMACGLCVVSTNVGGISNLIESRRTGMLVDPGDSQSMATAVCELVENAALASQVSAAGLERAKEHDWSRVMPLWKSLFQEVQRIGD